MAQSADCPEVAIAPASAWRLTMSATVLFLLQYAIGMLLSMFVVMPVVFFYFFPKLEEATKSEDPQAFFDLFPAFPLMFAAMIALQVIATALGLGFVVGKKWAGARLVFIRD